MAGVPTFPSQAAAFQSGVTVGAVIRAAFPEGIPRWRVHVDSNSASVEEKTPRPFDPDATIQHPPNDPLDVFAVAALLLARSGAYHHVQAVSGSIPTGATPEYGNERRLLVSEQDRRRWRRAGAKWAEVVPATSPNSGRLHLLVLLPKLARKCWKQLVDCQSLPVFEPLEPSDQPPPWWRAALALLVMADEACRDVGFLPVPPQASAPEAATLGFVTMVANRIRRAMLEQHDADGRGVYTLSAADPDVACVLPKSRTPSLGCTLRSLSHNVALLPPRGLARARWLVPKPEDASPDRASALNLLLVPYPYRIAASAFRAEAVSPADAGRRWQWFAVSPGAPEYPPSDWEAGVDRKIIDFTKALAQASTRDVGRIDGIVFPELSLSWTTYEMLVEELSVRHPSLAFVIAGLRTNEEKKAGNFVAITLLPKDPASLAGRQLVEDVRQKHHRWRLDSAQITAYSLGASLDPSKSWWERLNVLSRSLSVGVLRGDTTIAALICEDLARVDPAQELLRAIGPNLVFALLMDGPQLQTRWPNRYATVLAEDPGSSVLTFTSLGLIERVNGSGQFPDSRCVALWRDDRGVRELHLHGDAQALCLTLIPCEIEEHTLDGRSDSRNALAWRFGGVTPLRSNQELPAWRP